MIRSSHTDFSNLTFGITHTGKIDETESLKTEIIEQFHPKEVIVHYMGASMGTYAGKDGMNVSYL